MRKLLIAVLVTALAGVLAATALAGGRTVKVGDDYFVRDNGDRHAITVATGTRVTFRWVGHAAHDVHATSGPATFRSKLLGHGGRYHRTFKRRGTYRLVCDVHPTKMILRVKVR
jgi:plastocyanin